MYVIIYYLLLLTRSRVDEGQPPASAGGMPEITLCTSVKSCNNNKKPLTCCLFGNVELLTEDGGNGFSVKSNTSQ